MYFSLFLYNLVLFFFTASYFLHTFIIYVTHIGITFAKHTERYLSQNNFSRIFQNLTIILHQFNIERVPFLFFFFSPIHSLSTCSSHKPLYQDSWFTCLCAFACLFYSVCIFNLLTHTFVFSLKCFFFLIHFQEKCDPLIFLSFRHGSKRIARFLLTFLALHISIYKDNG